MDFKKGGTAARGVVIQNFASWKISNMFNYQKRTTDIHIKIIQLATSEGCLKPTWFIFLNQLTNKSPSRGRIKVVVCKCISFFTVKLIRSFCLWVTLIIVNNTITELMFTNRRDLSNNTKNKICKVKNKPKNGNRHYVPHTVQVF